MLIDRVRKTIEEHTMISRGDHIVLGLSGGPDSVCLFHILRSLAEGLELSIHPVHVNHGFRPGHAEKDQKYVEEICRLAGWPCISFVIDCNALAEEEGLTSEEAGRKARYDSFHSVAAQISRSTGHDPVKIAVAQNANDQAETVLQRIIRGTGPDGLAGIPYVREERGFKVIRPLLDVSRQEIEEFCSREDLSPVTDHTNMEPIYTRNRIRLELLPLLQEYNSNILGSLNRLARIAAADREFMETEAAKAMEDLVILPEEESEISPAEELILRREPLAQLPDTIRHRVVKRSFERVGLDQDITEERLVAADAIICRKQGPKTVEFPHGFLLKVAAGKVYITKK